MEGISELITENNPRNHLSIINFVRNKQTSKRKRPWFSHCLVMHTSVIVSLHGTNVNVCIYFYVWHQYKTENKACVSFLFCQLSCSVRVLRWCYIMDIIMLIIGEKKIKTTPFLHSTTIIVIDWKKLHAYLKAKKYKAIICWALLQKFVFLLFFLNVITG